MSKSKVLPKEIKILHEMVTSLKKCDPLYAPSKYWEVIAKKNIDQLQTHGLENFKIYQALDYFTFLVFEWNYWQFQFVLQRSSFLAILKALFSAITSHPFRHFPMEVRQRWIYILYNCLLWEYVNKIDTNGLLSLQEPTIGNPLLVQYGKKIISQDVSNSVLETYSILEALEKTNLYPKSILELGGGYGRNAYILKKHFPKVKIIMVDIAPALLIAQWYLAKVFPQENFLHFTDFSKITQIANKFQKADFVFLLPQQIAMLPNDSIDVFININSLQEMSAKQIQNYFSQINRITNGIFYMKQWKVAQNHYDTMFISEYEYPVGKNWKKLFHRDAKVQSKFFEAAYKIS